MTDIISDVGAVTGTALGDRWRRPLLAPTSSASALRHRRPIPASMGGRDDSKLTPMPNVFHGVDREQLAVVLAAGVDHGGNPIEPFDDPEGGWPLRCCLQDSTVGERLAVIAWSPFAWPGPYRETGPIVVHADRCPAPAGELPRLPAALEARSMVLRPYSHDHRIVYDLVTHLPDGGNITHQVDRLLDHPDVAEVHGRNWTGGCYAFTARRAP